MAKKKKFTKKKSIGTRLVQGLGNILSSSTSEKQQAEDAWNLLDELDFELNERDRKQKELESKKKLPSQSNFGKKKR